jgi:ABC-type lipoprotein release transport system permease subunit
MSGLLTLAWRNIWRHRRRTAFSMVAIGVGLVLVLFYSGLIGGMLGEAKNQLDNGGMGHVEVFPTGWRPKKLATVTMPDRAAWASKVTLPAGTEIGDRVVAKGLASSARGNEPVELLGVDWKDEVQLSAHLRDVREGALPEAGDDHGILVGLQLAERLKLKPGSKLRVMVQRTDGEMGADLFRVRGVFHSISSGIGKRQVLVSKAAARTLLGLGDVSHQVVIQLADAAQADAVAAQLKAALGEGYEVKTWGELLPVMKRMEALTNNVVFAIALFVYLLVGLGILNTMLMSVLERTREFGVLMSVGTRPARVVSLVVAESFWVATLSVVLGGALGAALTWYFSVHPLTLWSGSGEAFELEGMNISTAIRAHFDVTNVVKASSFVYAMALVVGVYPALRIARMQPSEALRHT